jgi:hypothetical protein
MQLWRKYQAYPQPRWVPVICHVTKSDRKGVLLRGDEGSHEASHSGYDWREDSKSGIDSRFLGVERLADRQDNSGHSLGRQCLWGCKYPKATCCLVVWGGTGVSTKTPCTEPTPGFFGRTKLALVVTGDIFNNWRVIEGDFRGNYAARRQRAKKQEGKLQIHGR